MSSPEAVLESLKTSMQSYSTRLKDRLVGLAEVVETIGLHLANLDEGHLVDKYDLNLSQIENYPVATSEEAILAESHQMYVDIEAAMAFISQNIGSNSGVETGDPIAPANNAVLFNDQPELIGGAYSHLHAINRAYRIFQVDILAGNYSLPVFFTNVNADNVVTDPLTRGNGYRWRYRDIANTGESGPWKESVFSVASVTVVAPIISYTFPINSAPIEPAFDLSAYQVTGTDTPDSHVSTTWTLRRTSDNSVVASGTKTSGDLTALTLPALVANTQYKLQVYYTGSVYGNSGVSEQTFTTINAFVNPPSVVLDGDVANASLTPTFTIGTFSTTGQSDTLHTQEMELVRGGVVIRRWRATVADGLLREVDVSTDAVMTTEAVTFPLTTFTVNGSLQAETEHTFRVRQRGQTVTYGAWGSQVFTTRMISDAEYIGITGTKAVDPKYINDQWIPQPDEQALMDSIISFVCPNNTIVTLIHEGSYLFLNERSSTGNTKTDLGTLVLNQNFPGDRDSGPHRLISADIDDTFENIYALFSRGLSPFIATVCRINLISKSIVWAFDYNGKGRTDPPFKNGFYQIAAPKPSLGFNYAIVATTTNLCPIKADTGEVGDAQSTWFYNNYYYDTDLARLSSFTVKTIPGDNFPTVVATSFDQGTVYTTTGTGLSHVGNPRILHSAADRKTFPAGNYPVDVAFLVNGSIKRFGILVREGNLYKVMIRERLNSGSCDTYRYIRLPTTASFTAGRIITDDTYFYIILRSTGRQLLIVKMDHLGNVIYGASKGKHGGLGMVVTENEHSDMSFSKRQIVTVGAGNLNNTLNAYEQGLTTQTANYSRQALHVGITEGFLYISGYHYRSDEVAAKISAGLVLKVPVDMTAGYSLNNLGQSNRDVEIRQLKLESILSDVSATDKYPYPNHSGISKLGNVGVGSGPSSFNRRIYGAGRTPLVPFTDTTKGLIYRSSQLTNAFKTTLNVYTRQRAANHFFSVPSKDENYHYQFFKGRVIIVNPRLPNSILGEFQTYLVNNAAVGPSDQWLLVDVTYDNDAIYTLVIGNPNSDNNGIAYITRIIRPASNDTELVYTACKSISFTYPYSQEPTSGNAYQLIHRCFFFDTLSNAYHRPLILKLANRMYLFTRSTLAKSHIIEKTGVSSYDNTITAGLCTANHVFIALSRGRVVRCPWYTEVGGDNNPYYPDRGLQVRSEINYHDMFATRLTSGLGGIAGIWCAFKQPVAYNPVTTASSKPIGTDQQLVLLDMASDLTSSYTSCRNIALEMPPAMEILTNGEIIQEGNVAYALHMWTFYNVKIKSVNGTLLIGQMGTTGRFDDFTNSPWDVRSINIVAIRNHATSPRAIVFKGAIDTLYRQGGIDIPMLHHAPLTELYIKDDVITAGFMITDLPQVYWGAASFNISGYPNRSIVEVGDTKVILRGAATLEIIQNLAEYSRTQLSTELNGFFAHVTDTVNNVSLLPNTPRQAVTYEVIVNF